MSRSIIALCLLVWGLGAQADGTARSWLEKMTFAGRELSYEGVFVYLHGNQMEAMRVVHSVENGSTKERLYSLNGAPREVIRDDTQVWCYLPDKKIGVREYRKATDKAFPNILPDRLDSLSRSYDLEVDGRERVAERATRLIVVRPKDAYRYGYRFWIDEGTGLLLKSDLVDEEGNAIEQYMFIEVEIGERIQASALTSHTPKSDLVWHGEQVRAPAVVATDTAWRIDDLPPSYALTSDILRILPMDKRPVRHLVYADGLATVSVFIQKLDKPGAKPMVGATHMGAVHAYGRLVDGYQITVVGEVPAQTVQLLAKSISRER